MILCPQQKLRPNELPLYNCGRTHNCDPTPAQPPLEVGTLRAHREARARVCVCVGGGTRIGERTGPVVPHLESGGSPPPN